jgi:hypothetical protein
VTDDEYNAIPVQKTTTYASAEQQLIDLSKKKWRWMADKNVDSLNGPKECWGYIGGVGIGDALPGGLSRYGGPGRKGE